MSDVNPITNVPAPSPRRVTAGKMETAEVSPQKVSTKFRGTQLMPVNNDLCGLASQFQLKRLCFNACL